MLLLPKFFQCQFSKCNRCVVFQFIYGVVMRGSINFFDDMQFIHHPLIYAVVMIRIKKNLLSNIHRPFSYYMISFHNHL